VSYFQRVLNKPLKQEPLFPLLLNFNYNGVIRPRCELIKDRVKKINIEEVLPCSEAEFCDRFGVTQAELEEKKAERKVTKERDRLWAYVPAV